MIYSIIVVAACLIVNGLQMMFKVQATVSQIFLSLCRQLILQNQPTQPVILVGFLQSNI